MFHGLLTRVSSNPAACHADLNYGREVIVDWGVRSLDRREGPARILDIGCGLGFDLSNVRAAVKGRPVELYGVECYPDYIKECETKGITVFPLNLEHDRIPAADGFFDVVIANQIIEHSKELFWIFGEVSRVLKPGGTFIVGVPNMASLHNRALLLFGEQPTSLELLGPHVRGFTLPSLRRFTEADGYFRVAGVRGSNFYPFPPAISGPLSRLLPTMSASIFVKAVRTDKAGTYLRVLDSRAFETPFYRG